MNLRGSQNENDVGRRFFQGFQQRVKSRYRQHVNLVDDINPVLGRGRREVGFLNQSADAVYSVVTGCVNLHHIQNRSLFQASADLAFPAGIPVLRIQTIDRSGQNFGTGGLARSAGTGEQISVGNSAPHELVFQGYGDLGLAHHVGKELGAIFPIQHFIQGRSPPEQKQ